MIVPALFMQLLTRSRTICHVTATSRPFFRYVAVAFYRHLDVLDVRLLAESNDMLIPPAELPRRGLAAWCGACSLWASWPQQGRSVYENYRESHWKLWCQWGTPLKTHGKTHGKNPWHGKTHGKTMENTKLLTLDLHSPGNPRCPKSMAATRKGFAWFCLRKGDKKFTQLCCCWCQVQLPLGWTYSLTWRIPDL